MLNHIGQPEVAEKIQNAWLKTIEDGIHTADIFKEGVSSLKVGTKEFAEAVCKNLGANPGNLKAVSFAADKVIRLPKYQRKPSGNKELLGVDLFIHWPGTDADELASKVSALNDSDFSLTMITNRGIKVWPEGFPETFCTDHWRCRFKNTVGGKISKNAIIQALSRADELKIDVIKTENLYAFNGKPAFSLGQGQ
jgi:isocitrate dehydrogenase